MQYMMKIFSYLLIFIFSFASIPTLLAQKVLENRLIVRTNSIAKLKKEYSTNFRESTPSIEVLSEDLGAALMVKNDAFSKLEIEKIKNLTYVIGAFLDREVAERTSPNDPFFKMQSYLDLINVPKVWELTTGGKTNDGKDIVIAVLDSGMDINHPDLKDNIYLNMVEIDGDLKDNDANGYVDDIHGLNVSKNTGVHELANHGTWVCGIAGASGNNDVGVTGVNWNVKILPISGVNNISTVIKGYDYALKMKKLYIQTNGVRGANVLVTNYSGGLDNAFGNDPEYRPWCDMYDLLGAQGILSFGSTTNNETNIDVAGDMPSTCDSEFFIGVTSTDALGIISRNSGFGTSNIDLAAPGENIFNTRTDNKYYENSGTSASSPLAAGVAALLFSVPCDKFSELLNTDRITAARAVRNALFLGVKKTDNLKTFVKYGGYLDAYGALINMQSTCDGQLPLPSVTGKLAIDKIIIEGNDICVSYITPKAGNYSIALYDATGKLIVKKPFIVTAFGDNTILIEKQSLPQAYYYFKLLSDTGESAAKSAFVW